MSFSVPAAAVSVSSSTGGTYGGYGGYGGASGGYGGGGGSGYGSTTSTNPSAGQDYAFAGSAAAASAAAASALSYAADNDDKYGKKTSGTAKKRRSASAKGLGTNALLSDDVGWTVLCLLAGVFFIWAVLTTVLWSNASGKTKRLLQTTGHDSIRMLQDSYQQLQTDLQTMQKTLQRTKQTAETQARQEKNALERQNRLLEKERDELRRRHEKLEDNHARHGQIMKKVNSREQAYANQVHWLIRMARRESKREILERYGRTLRASSSQRSELRV
jgi:gas vesicle protein